MSGIEGVKEVGRKDYAEGVFWTMKVDFGEVKIGLTKKMKIQIENDSNKTDSFEAVLKHPQFRIDPKKKTITAKGSRSFEVYFTPVKEGTLLIDFFVRDSSKTIVGIITLKGKGFK